MGYSKDIIWNWLEEVPDPEIPVISIVDLGIVRNVSCEGDTVEVVLTPTYSGCPATRVISDEVEAALRKKGLKTISITTQISPPWTTDWMSENGRLKLEEYGIAPPQQSGQPLHCPLCGDTAVSKVSQFGSTPCKALWRCDACLEPFDYFKCL